MMLAKPASTCSLAFPAALQSYSPKFLALPSSDIMAIMLAALDELQNINTVEQAKDWDAAWNALRQKLGQVTNLRVLAAIPPHTVKREAQNATKIIRVAATAVVALLYRVARQKVGLNDVEPFQPIASHFPISFSIHSITLESASLPEIP